MSKDLKKNMVGALAWSSVNVFGVQFVQLLIGVLLARLLTPKDFGEVGILFVFVGFSTVLIDGGFAQGLIRKQDATSKDFSTVFYFNMMLAVLLYLCLYFLAPLIADFFELPQLANLSRVLFLSILLFSFYIIQQAQLYKKLDYKSQAFINITSVALSGVVAIVMAMKGFAVWALVLQQVLFHLIKALLFPLFLKWKPRWEFSFQTIRQLSGFSIPLLGQTTLNVLFNNIYTLLIGKFYPIQQVGYFNQANKYSETVNTATQTILFAGTFPLLSQIQDDVERLLRVYRKLLQSVALITFPLVVFLIVVAEPLIVTIISEKWIFSVRFFQILILANWVTPIYNMNTNLLNARGESKSVLRMEVIKKSLIVISILLCFRLGIEALLLGLVIANFTSFLVSMGLVKKSIDYYYRYQLADITRIVLTVTVLGAIVFLFNKLFPCGYVIQLLLDSLLFLLLYAFSLKWFFPTQFDEVKSVIVSKLKLKPRG